MCADLTIDESRLYDRQIRLWGQEGQKRLKGCTILLVDFVGPAFEFSKNLILAGIKCLYIYGETCSQDDLDYLQDLNRNVPITVLPASQFEECAREVSPDFVCLMSRDLQKCAQLSRISHGLEIPFMCGDVFGVFAYFFIDLGDNFGGFCRFGEDVLEAVISGGASPRKWKYARILFYLYALGHSHDEVEERFPHILESPSWRKQAEGCLAPVCSVVGGLMAHKVCEIVQGNVRGEENMFVYDGFESVGIIKRVNESGVV